MPDKSKIGAVMVAGGGLAGMQASLDAAAAGYKVYLVERDLSIGGVMAQLDKTFPTNDCSTCLISPKLIEVARHPDIEIITQAELEAWEGEAGHFTATLICLESREELPASPWEVEEAEAEGIPLVTRWGVKQILSAAGKVTGIELKAVARVFADQGRFSPAYHEDQTAGRDAEVDIIAIGRKTDVKFLNEADGIALTPGVRKNFPRRCYLQTAGKGFLTGFSSAFS